MNTKAPGEAAPHHDKLVVQVRYLAASQPFVDPHADESETLAQLKPRVLAHFGLIEGDVPGGRKEYAFSINGLTLTDLSVTISSLAEGKHRVELNLLEQFTQG